MGNASRDDNNVPSLLGISSVDGITPIPIKVNPLTGAVLLEIIGGGGGGGAVDSVNGQSLEIGGETFSTYKTIKALQDGVLNSIICTSSTNSNGTVSIKLYHNGTLHSTITYVGTLANGKYNKVFTSPTDFTQIDFNKYDIIEIRVSDTGTSLSTDLTITLG